MDAKKQGRQDRSTKPSKPALEGGLHSGSGGGARTHDNRINSAALCQLSYPGRKHSDYQRLHQSHDHSSAPSDIDRCLSPTEELVVVGPDGLGDLAVWHLAVLQRAGIDVALLIAVLHLEVNVCSPSMRPNIFASMKMP